MPRTSAGPIFISPSGLGELSEQLHNQFVGVTMADDRSVNNIAKDALLRGVGKGGLGAVNKRIVQAFIDKLGDKCPEPLKTEAGKRALEVLLPYVLLQATEFGPVGDRLPAKEKIQKALEMMMEDAAQRATGQVLETLMDMVMPIFQELEAVAGELPDLQVPSSEGLSLSMEEAKSTVKVKEKVAA